MRYCEHDTGDGTVMLPFMCPGPRSAAESVASVPTDVASRAAFHAPPGLHGIANADLFYLVRGLMHWPPSLRQLGSTIPRVTFPFVRLPFYGIVNPAGVSVARLCVRSLVSPLG
jgi:hypothetical protein